jgi:tRNA A37 methylthiotransferase MiaB
MESSGFKRSSDEEEADVLFLNTCAIRDKAEQRIWNRLSELKALKKKRAKTRPLTVGVLGNLSWS